jgi:FXSXX-COOH protein
LSTYGDRVPEGPVSGGSGVRGGTVVDEGLVDLSGFSLEDLRNLLDASDESYLAHALRRLTGSEGDGSYGFNSRI